MNRKDELLKIFENIDKEKQVLIEKIIDEVVFLEKNLEELKKLPFVKVHPNNSELQKVTSASKQYKELSQVYINTMKLLSGMLGNAKNGEESPLRAYMSKFLDV